MLRIVAEVWVFGKEYVANRLCIIGSGLTCTTCSAFMYVARYNYCISYGYVLCSYMLITLFYSSGQMQDKQL